MSAILQLRTAAAAWGLFRFGFNFRPIAFASSRWSGAKTEREDIMTIAQLTSLIAGLTGLAFAVRDMLRALLALLPRRWLRRQSHQ